MKKVLFVSFDLIRENDPKKSLSVASILALLKNDECLRSKYEFDHLSVNVHAGESWREKTGAVKFSDYSFIAISAYIWNRSSTNEFLEYLRCVGFSGSVILGGYQIAGGSLEEYKTRYPHADIFVEGYAENALLNLLAEDDPSANIPKIIKTKLKPDVLISPFLSGEINITQGMEMLRFETKRGCPYSCSFCRHRDVINNTVYALDKNRIIRELDLFISMGVKKINIVDPVFHIKNYKEILPEMISLCKRRQTKTRFTLQCQLDFIARNGGEFLNLCKQGDFILELGLQTCDEKISALINRKFNMTAVETALETLRDSGIKHEITMIYGLPGQTLAGFTKGMEFLKKKCRDSNCEIKAYPLLLLPGTQLYAEKEKYNFEESENTDGLNIPHVVSSNSFSYNDWQKMKEIADG